AGDRSLEILGQAAVSIEPSEGSFDDPSPWEELKSGRVGGAFDNLDGPLAEFGESVTQIGAVIDTVGEEMAQPGKQIMDRRNDQPGTIAILDISGVHLGSDQQTGSIGHNVALTPFDLLGRIVTTRPAALGRLDRLTVDDPRRWSRFTARRFARLHQPRDIHVLKQAIDSPIVEIALHRRELRKVVRLHPQLTADPLNMLARVKHSPQ